MALQEEMDRCVSCGFCLPACPTYQLTDDEVLSPRGRIALMRAITAGELEASAENLDTYGECLGCRACESACPSGVHYEDIFLKGRELLQSVAPAPFRERVLLNVLRSPARLRLLTRLWRVVGRPLRWLARMVRASRGPLSLLRALPVAAGKPRQSVGETSAWLHEGCIMSVAFSRTNARAQDLIERQGTSCGASGPLCCGALHAHSGQNETAKRMARTLIDAFERSGASVVISTAGGCGAWLRSYAQLLHDDPDYAERAAKFSMATRDISEWLVASGFTPPKSDVRLTYQDSCHLRHGQKVSSQPRQLLSALGQYQEMDGAATCCGSAGIYNLSREETSARVLQEKLGPLKDLEVAVLATSNPGCELQMRHGVTIAGLPVRVAHVVDLLYEAMPGA